MIAKEKSFAKGLVSAAKVALGGRNFVEADEFSLHLIAEGRSNAGVAADVAEMRRIAAAHGGREIESTIARIIRAVPFPPLNSMLGPEGEAWVPVHGMISLSEAPALFASLEALFAEFAPTFDAHGIYTGYLFTSVSTNAITIEPVFYWPHGWRPIHEVHVEPTHLARLPKLAANPAATAVVADAKQRVVDLFADYGCGHFQIGRTYPYRESRDDASRQAARCDQGRGRSAGPVESRCARFPNSMSETYRAIRLERFADTFRAGTEIVSLPIEPPGEQEIRVRNHWCGVNGIFDTEFARGKAGYMTGALPSFTGVEAVGIVEAIGGDVEGFAIGDAVASMRFRSGYREVNVAPASQFAALPDVGAESLALASTGVAALLALEHAGQVRDGETVAVSAAAGGLGHLIVQLARLRGCRVVAICGGADKAAFVRGLGAARVIDLSRRGCRRGAGGRISRRDRRRDRHGGR